MLDFLQSAWQPVLTSPAFWAVLLFASAATYVQMRGRVRMKLRRQIFDHSTFTAPYNALMYWFSAAPNTPFLDLDEFPELRPLADNWQMIRDEALRLFDDGYIRAAEKNADAGFRTFFRTGWKRFYVKWYEDALPSARALCPQTTELVASIPSVNAAMFTLLPPGARLGAHRDPFAASLRYHLGLKTPNSEDCFIAVDGEPYYWRDGEAVMFDETYVHTAENRTEDMRLILLCDIERPLTNGFARGLNRWLGHRIIRSAASPNIAGDKTGPLSTISAGIHSLQAVGKRIKAWNKPTYWVLKKALLLGLLYLIFF
jgi:beta-hydroxylase